MKHTSLLLLIITVLISSIAYATIDEYYSFTPTNGTYTPITGTAVTDILMDDALSGTIPMGMNFSYGEASFTEIKISSNGWIGLGASQTSYNLSNDLTSMTTIPVVAPLWDDTSLAGGSCSYLLSGTTPNRVFTVQYADLKWSYSATNQFNFQVRLYETGKIEFIYGSYTGTPSNANASIGINMTTGGSGWFYSVTPGNPATASTTTENNTISTFPAQGTIYQFDPVIAVPNDLTGLSISGNTTPTAGTPSTYNIEIRNRGSVPQTAYQVKLFRGAAIEVGSANGTLIQPGQVLTFSILWSPAAQGTDTIYGKVVLAGDENPANDQTPSMSVNVFPAGVWSLTVGDGSEQARVPMDFYWRNSLFETLYYPAEMGNFMGQILGLRFWSNFSTNLPNGATKVWIGTTTQTDLSAGWIPSTQLTLVFDGTLSFPSGANLISINFVQPYMYLNGQNLVVMVNRPMDTVYYSFNDFFEAQTVGSTRARNIYSDSTEFDPANPPGDAPVSGQFPKTGFIVIPGGVGHLNGTVTGSGGVPLQGVSIQFASGGYSATTDAQGHYAIVNILPNTYTVNYSIYGYQNDSQQVSIAEDETVTLNVTMTPLPIVSVNGTVIASDTLAGINGASIHLEGYADYDANSTATGSFSIPGVYANNNYSYVILAPGYTAVSGTINVTAGNYSFGNVTLNEVAYAPHTILAEVNTQGNAVQVNWQAPDPNAVEISESFENEGFPPQNWSQMITDTGPVNPSGVLPTWCRFGSITISGQPANPTEGSYQSGLWWDYAHQDEWLVTPSFNCPPAGYLVFDSWVFLGSTNGDHYYVNVSTDNGNNWTELWDASTQTGGWNYYASPITVPLDTYSGQQIKIAFNASDGPNNDGMWYVWFIDDVYIGNALTGFADFSPAIHFSSKDLTARSEAYSGAAIQKFTNCSASRVVEMGLTKYEPRLPFPTDMGTATTSSRSLTGYKVWRLTQGQEDNETAWTSLTPAVINTQSYTDTSWLTLPNGIYRWAVKAYYTNDVYSVPSFSNTIIWEQETGMIAGVVRRSNTAPIVGATVSANGVSATTNNAGAYTLMLPVGTYSVTCSATGYGTQTVEGVIVNSDQTVTQNFIMISVANDDDVVPVNSTELLGNHPNPFNSSTEICYSVKEASPVRIEIFNNRGQRVRLLVDAIQANGLYATTWNGLDDNGRAVSSGVYLYRMSAGSFYAQKKMILLQ